MLLVVTLVVSGCSSGSAQNGNGASCNLANFLAVQHAHVNHAEVTLCGTIVRVRAPRESRSGLHQLVYVDVGHDDRVEIDLNLDVLGALPVHTGESTVIQGEYYYDPDGHEGVHWTHHTDYGHHPPGYIILDGRRYV